MAVDGGVGVSVAVAAVPVERPRLYVERTRPTSQCVTVTLIMPYRMRQLTKMATRIQVIQATLSHSYRMHTVPSMTSAMARCTAS